MQAVCDILEQLASEGILKQYAIGGATAAGFHGEPLFNRNQFATILREHGLHDRWQQWSTALGLDE